MKNRQWACFVIAGILLMMLADVFLIHMEYENYQDKMEILYAMLASETMDENNDTDLEMVTGLLKGNHNDYLSDAKEQLEQYGYTESYTDYYRKIMYRQWVTIICLSVIQT